MAENNVHGGEHRGTTAAERERAEAVHSVDDATRTHSSGDETELTQGAGGELLRPPAEDRAGHQRDTSASDESEPEPYTDSEDDQDAEPTMNAPEEDRPDRRSD